jgi:hypothetical protein
MEAHNPKVDRTATAKSAVPAAHLGPFGVSQWWCQNRCLSLFGSRLRFPRIWDPDGGQPPMLTTW